ncbi:MAG: hypothetical protein Q8P50_13265 [Bacillota bacterium]|nr:hypothetical protein [Bacillota bacterium]
MNHGAILNQFPFAQPQPLEFRGAWVEPYDGYMAAFGIAFHAGVARIQGKTAGGWEGSVEPVNGFWLLEATASGPKDEWLLVRALGHDGELIHVFSRPNWWPLPRWSPEA